jgi:hypothetical protein
LGCRDDANSKPGDLSHAKPANNSLERKKNFAEVRKNWTEVARNIAEALAFVGAAVFFFYKAATGYETFNASVSIEGTRTKRKDGQGLLAESTTVQSLFATVGQA